MTIIPQDFFRFEWNCGEFSYWCWFTFNSFLNSLFIHHYVSLYLHFSANTHTHILWVLLKFYFADNPMTERESERVELNLHWVGMHMHWIYLRSNWLLNAIGDFCSEDNNFLFYLKSPQCGRKWKVMMQMSRTDSHSHTHECMKTYKKKKWNNKKKIFSSGKWREMMV